MSKKSSHVAIWRNDKFLISALEISDLEHKFIKLCKKKSPLYEIFKKLSKINHQLDMQAILKKFIEKQIIISFT